MTAAAEPCVDNVRASVLAVPWGIFLDGPSSALHP